MSRGSKRWQDYVRRARIREFGGIELCVYSFGDPERDEVVFHGLTLALRLISEVQPWRRHMLPRHIRRILSVYPLGAEYVHSIEACVIGYKSLEEGRIRHVAEAIIHELTHARIENCGIAYTNATRARIEQLCFKAELNFMQAVASAPRLTRGQLPALDPWWTEEHRVQGIVDQLRELGAPRFVISAALVVYRTKRRLFRQTS